MLNTKRLKYITEVLKQNTFNITCQKSIIELNLENNTMDKKTLLSSLNDKIKIGLKANYPLTDRDSDWIGVTEASKITGLNRPNIYNLISENWFATRSQPWGNSTKVEVFKPHVLTYNLQLEIIQDLIDSNYIKEEIDVVTGRRRYLEFMTSASAIGELETAVKWRSLFATYNKLKELFEKIDYSPASKG